MVKPVRVYEEYRVVVIPSLSRKMTRENHDINHGACRQLAKEIERYCDGWAQTYIEFSAHEKCPYCGAGWETYETGLPVCCIRAQEEWDDEQLLKEVPAGDPSGTMTNETQTQVTTEPAAGSAPVAGLVGRPKEK